MTIERNRPWGSAGGLDRDDPVARTDAELRSTVESARRAGRSVPRIGLLGGDLCRTLGGTGDEARLRSPDAMRFPVDVGRAVIDGETHWFVAHLLARRSWWRGRLLAVMNAEFIGDWDVAPRSHPNDGALDVIDADPGPADRWKARRRLAAGAHIPHPSIRYSRAEQFDTVLAPGTRVWLDGQPLGPARRLQVAIEPDAFVVVV